MSNKKDKAIYLKVSINKYFTMMCIQSWLNLATIYDARLYIICEKPEIINAINNNCLFGTMVVGEYAKEREMENDPLFVGAYFDELSTYAGRLVKPNWVKAAVSHLTTFYHAQEKGYASFWNIDADDTLFFSPTAIGVKEAFQKVETLPLDYDCLSLDMWNTHSEGTHWSFGVSYIYTNRPWKIFIEENIEAVHERWKNTNLPENIHNLDWYFTGLKFFQIIKAETFYIDNATFCHYGLAQLDGYRYPGIGLNYWSDNKIVYPLVNIEKAIPRLSIKIKIDSEMSLPPNMPDAYNCIKSSIVREKQEFLKKIYVQQLNSILELKNNSFIYTYHDDFLSYDYINNKFYHGYKLIDHINYTIIDKNISLLYNNRFIKFDTNSSVFQLSDTPTLYNIIYNNDGTISIMIADKYLSAWSNGAIVLMPHCLEWEKFYI